MVLACACMATGLYIVSLGPFFALVEAEHLTPRFVRELPAITRSALLTLAALRLYLGGIHER